MYFIVHAAFERIKLMMMMMIVTRIKKIVTFAAVSFVWKI